MISNLRHAHSALLSSVTLQGACHDTKKTQEREYDRITFIYDCHDVKNLFNSSIMLKT